MDEETDVRSADQLALIAGHLQQIVLTLGSIDRRLEHIAKGTPAWAQEMPRAGEPPSE